MERSNRLIVRVIAIMLAVTLTVCAFSSCGKKNEEEEITRGSEQIEKPSETSAEDVTSAEGEVTTSAAGNLAALATTAAANDNGGAAQSQDSGSGSSGGSNTGAMAGFVNAMGFDYDSTQGIFYTNLDNWQRSANYVGHYDTFAQFGNMRYRTAKMDFGACDGLDWRIQIWKGQYGVFGGSEIGVYTKDPVANEMLYNCADNDHLLYMESAMYLTKADYTSGNVYFTRAWQAHWWLTGFKAGVVEPTQLIMVFRIRMKSLSMAEMFENALVATGFQKGDAKTQYDTYKRSLNDFYVLWDDVGDMNYVAQGS